MLLSNGNVLIQDDQGIGFRQLDLQVDQGIIVQLGQHLEPRASEKVISVMDKWLIPGLIDAHVHTTGLYGGVDPFLTKDISAAEVALRAAHGAQMLLYSGFTTIRDMGGREYVDIALRNAINEGIVPGPRMYASGRPLCITGGHASLLLRSREVDGLDEARKGVREQLAMTADQIKVMATGGGVSSIGAPGLPQLSLAELQAIVQEASRAEKKVAAHAHGLEGIKNAIKAGVQSIEHGTYADEETLVKMVKNNIYLVMCIGATAFMADNSAKAAGVPQFMQDNCKKLLVHQTLTFKKACELGVPIAFGSDCGTPLNPPGGTGREFEFLVENGMTEAQAIASATVEAAKLLGIEDRVGSLSPGKEADILVLQHNPLKDISVLAKPKEEIYCLLKRGTVVINAEAPSHRKNVL